MRQDEDLLIQDLRQVSILASEDTSGGGRMISDHEDIVYGESDSGKGEALEFAPGEILSCEWILFPLPWEFFRMTTMQAESSRHTVPGVHKTNETSGFFGL